MSTRSSILAWEIPWAKEPGGLQSLRSQRVTHNRACTHNLVCGWHQILRLCPQERCHRQEAEVQ